MKRREEERRKRRSSRIKEKKRRNSTGLQRLPQALRPPLNRFGPAFHWSLLGAGGFAAGSGRFCSLLGPLRLLLCFYSVGFFPVALAGCSLRLLLMLEIPGASGMNRECSAIAEPISMLITCVTLHYTLRPFFPYTVSL